MDSSKPTCRQNRCCKNGSDHRFRFLRRPLMDTTYEKIWEIIKNERDITLEEATQLSIIFNTDASFWMKLQELHETWFNKQK
ncbi:transcriptional regulator [Klebsiella pneumoniae]|uniref:helix-turn-helix transcriptional regulator n=1 Tax=Klebsiella pneumoniae TaxID=573 RepID=UPI0021CD3338|nr:hypothetical protein [Klebsiella pneumoniae]